MLKWLLFDVIYGSSRILDVKLAII